MVKKVNAALIKEEINSLGHTERSHPAFGNISISRVQSSAGKRFFGSSIKHNNYICLRIDQGIEVESYGIKKFRQVSRKGLIEVNLTQSQWASMVSSIGLGEGTPCTLEYYRDGDVISPGSIGEPESSNAHLRRILAESVSSQIETLQNKIKELEESLSNTKLNRKELQKQVTSLKHIINNTPENFAFATEVMEEVMEEIIENGKTELSSHAQNIALKVGLREISDLGKLPELINKRKSDG
jgi:hypothetical protein